MTDWPKPPLVVVAVVGGGRYAYYAQREIHYSFGVIEMRHGGLLFQRRRGRNGKPDTEIMCGSASSHIPPRLFKHRMRLSFHIQWGKGGRSLRHLPRWKERIRAVPDRDVGMYHWSQLLEATWIMARISTNVDGIPLKPQRRPKRNGLRRAANWLTLHLCVIDQI